VLDGADPRCGRRGRPGPRGPDRGSGLGLRGGACRLGRGRANRARLGAGFRAAPRPPSLLGALATAGFGGFALLALALFALGPLPLPLQLLLALGRVALGAAALLIGPALGLGALALLELSAAAELAFLALSLGRPSRDQRRARGLVLHPLNSLDPLALGGLGLLAVAALDLLPLGSVPLAALPLGPLGGLALLALALGLLELLGLRLLAAPRGAPRPAGVVALGAGVERGSADLGIEPVVAPAAAQVAGLGARVEGAGVLRALGLGRVARPVRPLLEVRLGEIATVVALRRDKKASLG
jgi:hypothetical protein